MSELESFDIQPGDISKLAATEKPPRRKRIAEMLRRILNGIPSMDTSNEFRRQRGTGQGAPSLGEEKDSIDGMTPKQQVRRKLEELSKLKDK